MNISKLMIFSSVFMALLIYGGKPYVPLSLRCCILALMCVVAIIICEIANDIVQPTNTSQDNVVDSILMWIILIAGFIFFCFVAVWLGWFLVNLVPFLN